MRANRPLILLPIAALLGASAIPFPTAAAANGTLPGGTAISVEINTPANGALLPPGPVTINGRASIGIGPAQDNTALIYVLDVSTSTGASGCAGTILTCEVAAAKALNDTAAVAGTIDKVGVVVFAGQAKFADVDPGGDGAPDGRSFTDPEADADQNQERDVTSVLNSVRSLGVGRFTDKPVTDGTFYSPAIQTAVDVALATGKRNKIVAFLSDGNNGEVAPPAGQPDPFEDAVNRAFNNGVVFKTFAIGGASSPVRCGAANERSLEAIANRTDGGAHCTRVTNLEELPSVVPGIIASQLTGLSLSVDGGPGVPITNVTRPLPLPGPDFLDYSVTTGPLAPGPHQLCVTAAGRDVGGPGSVTDCRSISINAPPVVDAGGPYSGNEDNPVQLNGTVTDPDGPAGTSTWTIVPGADVPPGSACTFGNPNVLSTTVSCTERGTYTLTLTANDGVNPPVVDRTSLTLRNVAPTVDAGGPYSGAEDNAVQLDGTVTDPDGPPFTATWSIEPTDNVPPGSACTFADPTALSTTVTCTERGAYTLTLTVSDGVNPPVTDEATLDLVNIPPQVSAGGPYLGQDNVPVPIAGTITDPDGPAITSTWTVTPAAGTTGTCTFANPAALSTTVTCTDSGSYTLTLTVNDGADHQVTATATLTVNLRPGPLSLTTIVEPATGFVGGDAIVVTHTVRNGGVTRMTDVRFSTTLPAGLIPASVAPANCASVCDLGTLAPGQFVQIRFTFPASAVVDLPVAATVTTTGPDTDTADNTSSVRVVVRQPVLTVNPGMGPQGFVTRATGRDFPAGARIRLVWSIGISEIPGEVTVRPDGTFDARVLIFHKDARGVRNLTAVPVSGPRFGTVSSNPFLVLPRSLKPLTFVIR